MKTIKEFEFCDLGADHSQYFQGFGVSFTNYEHCATGCGSSQAEAIDDLLEAVAQNGFDVNGLDVEILEDIGATEFATDDVADGETESEFFYYVGLRWNEDTTRADRLARLQACNSVRPSTYSSYQQTRNPDNGRTEWGYVSEIDGSVSYGDVKDSTWDNAKYVVLDCTVYSDYSGSTIQAANHKWFQDNFGSEDAVYAVYGGHDTTGTIVSVEWLLTAECAESAIEACEGLDNYPCFDDEAVSELESEKSDEAWHSWVSSDFAREVEKALDVEFGDYEDSDLRALFEACAEKANEYWFNEGSGTDMYIRIERIVAEVTADDVKPFVPARTVRVYRDGYPLVDGILHIDEFTVGMPLYAPEFEACMAALDDENSVLIGSAVLTWEIE